MKKVVSMPADENMTPQQALISASEFEDARQVVIAGYDREGELFVRSSSISNKDALWLAEHLKKHILEEM